MREILPGISRLGVTTGERCPIHHRDLVDGVCDVCLDLGLREKARREAAAAAALEERLGNIRLGKRYRNVAFESYLPTCDAAARVKMICQKYATTFADRLAGCDNLLMLGNPGTGKNMLAAAICHQIVQGGFQAVHTTALRLVRRIAETWGGKSTEKEQDVIDSFSLPDLLVVDEVGVQYDTVREKILLFEALNGRYEEEKPTIIISNYPLNDVERYLGPTVMDRFYEGKSSVLEFSWGSHRRRGKGGSSETAS